LKKQGSDTFSGKKLQPPCPTSYAAHGRLDREDQVKWPLYGSSWKGLAFWVTSYVHHNGQVGQVEEAILPSYVVSGSIPDQRQKILLIFHSFNKILISVSTLAHR
jgi:hypothetical protein